MVLPLETKTEEHSFVVPEEELEHCRECGKLFKPYKVETFGRERYSVICKECRKKYS
jgi:hypothetical protein